LISSIASLRPVGFVYRRLDNKNLSLIFDSKKRYLAMQYTLYQEYKRDEI